MQRPTQRVGGVYSYEAIVPGTTFRAELRVTAALAEQLDKTRDDWWQLLTGTARLGQSKKDSYGQVMVIAAMPERASPTTEIVSTDSNQLTVWLLSDLLLRDERLRPSTSVHDLAQALSEYLSCQMVPREKPSVLSQIARSHRIESWQVRWGLPRPSLAGFAAGSCFVFQCTDEQQINPRKLAELSIEGLGNRRAEGFGQLSFNSPLLTQPTSELTHPGSDDASASPSSRASLISPPTGDPTEEIQYARCIEKAAWRDAIQKAAEALAASSDRREHYLAFSGSQPGMSQLGSLRSLLTRLREPQQRTVTTWLSRVHEKRSEKWPAGSLDKLTMLLNNSNSVWQMLNEGIELAALPSVNRLVLVRGDESWLRTELWTEAVQILMATCIRAHKRALENDLNNSAEDDSHHIGGTNNGTAA
ncbi:MAG: hypothetical protein DCF15_06840 [Phormidesmis priestleyi]|uniref:CRISPR-associated protein Csx10 n=1 Tax=Phormidesmis priestleyi TaxID=268141 RepID=A0A2W4XN22_9CYAN|nr:MAG: hypothetical protein DCF15_06840 [Phormidesmis priestleyi]